MPPRSFPNVAPGYLYQHATPHLKKPRFEHHWSIQVSCSFFISNLNQNRYSAPIYDYFMQENRETGRCVARWDLHFGIFFSSKQFVLCELCAGPCRLGLQVWFYVLDFISMNICPPFKCLSYNLVLFLPPPLMCLLSPNPLSSFKIFIQANLQQFSSLYVPHLYFRFWCFL